MPANLLPRVSDSVFALSARIVKKELLFLIRSKTTDDCGDDWRRGHTSTCDWRPVHTSGHRSEGDYIRVQLDTLPASISKSVKPGFH